MSKGEITKNFGYNYSSVQNIILAYETSGRTNKLQYLDMHYHYKAQQQDADAS
jgi:hypothetical protein